MYQFYHDRYHRHLREVLSRVVQTLELMTLVCVMFGLLSDSLIGMLEGDLLGRFQRFATPPSADSHYTKSRAQRCYPLLKALFRYFGIYWVLQVPD